MHPFWNNVVKLCPRWLAPNLLTFSGFLLTVLNFVLLSYYDYYFYSPNPLHPEYKPIPKWVWMFCAISHFSAYTLDGIDGKQARRTNTSGPLGEMFDHGLDSWTTVFIPCCLFTVFGRDHYSISVLDFYICLWVVQVTFLSSHWEKYNTGILYLPWGYDVSQLVCLVVFLITFFADYTFWKFYIPWINVSAGSSLKIFLYVGSLGISLPISFYNIYLSYVNRTGKMRGFGEANRPLVSTVIFVIECTVWVRCSPNDVFNKDPRCFYVMTGTVLSNICCRLIVSQMTNTRCDVFNFLLVPVGLAVGFALSGHFPLSSELLLLRLLTTFVILVHVHYGVCVVRQMCDHFNIGCFTIKRQTED